MTTNKIRTTARPVRSSDTDPKSRRARLDLLLDVRWRLARLAVERRSHNLDDAIDVFLDQMHVEGTIDAEFPGVVDERFGDWLEADMSFQHDASVLHPECGICQGMAKRSGITSPRGYAA